MENKVVKHMFYDGATDRIVIEDQNEENNENNGNNNNNNDQGKNINKDCQSVRKEIETRSGWDGKILYVIGICECGPEYEWCMFVDVDKLNENSCCYQKMDTYKSN